MRKLKKPLSILLSLILVFSVFTVVPVVTAGAAEAEFFYVDEYGSDQTVTATILTGEEAVQSDGSVVLGTDSNTTTTWYAVLDDVTYGDADSTVNLEILGRVCIIVLRSDISCLFFTSPPQEMNRTSRCVPRFIRLRSAS